jgi:lysophospholipase L1-like esterase
MTPFTRSALRGILATAATIAAILAAEVAAAVLRPVPHQPEFDASGTVGTGAVRHRWLVLGDSSITAPGVAGPGDIWVRRVATARSGSGSIEITSLAVGGSCARHVRDEQIPRIPGDVTYDVVFVSVGANDVLKGEPLWRHRRALEDIVSRLTDRHGLIVLSGVGDLATIPRLTWPLDRIVGARAGRFDAEAQAIAERWGAAKVDHWATTAPAFRSDPTVFSADFFHPNARGHEIWANAVDDLLNRALD